MTGPGADGLSVTVVTSRVELEECWRIRFAVFVDEQDVPAEMEVDDLDTAVTTTHVLATVAGSAVATARLLPVEPGVVRIGRVAVAREARGTGAGRAVMEALHDVALATHAGPDGGVRVDIEAQEHAIPFYSRLGYALVDDRRYLDAGIWHRDMALDLPR
ncbi:GNAT family acetyltransferase YjcF [Actinomycetales bacterium JB111]|nr:GNAT family acetyltransferase YjcF [Actinomycetales bacterium JB111]